MIALGQDQSFDYARTAPEAPAELEIAVFPAKASVVDETAVVAAGAEAAAAVAVAVADEGSKYAPGLVDGLPTVGGETGSGLVLALQLSH